MATANVNSMPQNKSDGFRIVSPDPILTRKQYPTHLPLWFIFAKKGTEKRTLADGAVREQMYGAESFLASSKFFTHATLFANTVTAPGNQGIYQRLRPEGAKSAAVRLWLDILPVAIPLYERGTDGKYKLDEAGQLIPTGETTMGYKRKVVATVISELTGGVFGQASQMVGDQTDVPSSTQSTRYPWMDLPVSSFGKYGNDLGFRIWAPVAGARVEADAELLETNKAYPYVVSCQDRSSDTIQNVQSTAGTQEITVVFKPDQVKDSVSQEISFDPRFFEMYNDRERVGIAPLYGPFDQVHVYQDNLETVLKMFYDAEKTFIDEFSDFTGEGYEDADDGVGEIHRFNFISGKSSKNVPYHSFVIERAEANAEATSDISTIWALDGADGDLSLDSFNTLVRAEITKYGSIEYEQTENRLGNPVSHFYDSGYDSDTKLALANFIAVRKDTFLVWSLQDAQQATPLTADQESSLCVALFTRASLLPESSEFGTPASRFMIVGCDGRLISSTYRKRAPLSLEIASKSAEYMGAGNGLWNSAFRFSNGARAAVTMFRDVNVEWRPIAARQRDWANGMVYVQSKNMDDLFFPALQTGCTIKNSIAASYFNVCVLADLQKVADRVWSQFSGNDDLSNEQFKKYVEQECRDETEGKYDARVALVFTVNFTKVDEFNGYSWTLNIDVGGDVMKTVQYTLVTGYRRESMPSAT